MWFLLFVFPFVLRILQLGSVQYCRRVVYSHNITKLLLLFICYCHYILIIYYKHLQAFRHSIQYRRSCVTHESTGSLNTDTDILYLLFLSCALQSSFYRSTDRHAIHVHVIKPGHKYRCSAGKCATTINKSHRHYTHTYYYYGVTMNLCLYKVFSNICGVLFWK